MILVVAAAAKGRLTKGTYELVSAARQMGDEAPITLLVLGSSVNAIANEAATIVDQVLVADLPALATFRPEVWAQAVSTVASEGEARAVLISGGRSGREYSPRVAVRLKAALLENVISLSMAGNSVSAQRYSYLARATETIRTEAPIVVATVQPGAFPPAAPLAEVAEQFEVELSLQESRVTISDVRAEESSRVSLADADVVVAGGRGVRTAEGFDQLVVRLAETLGAAVGATRAVVDSGWRPYSEQVGQTGQTVQPRVYIAIGISGAAQHLSGMNKSKLIIAINKDADAPIFKIADHGLVGDVSQIVPALVEQLRQ